MSEVLHAPSSADVTEAPSGRADAGASSGTGNSIAAAAAQDLASSSAGHGLDPRLKTKMESAFGADFSAVRVHTDAAAAEAAQQLNAHAFAQGSDIFFDSGKYDPGSEDGEKLIAHELAHVVQTGGGDAGAQRKAAGVSAPGDAAEAAADAAAEKAVKGQPVGDVGTAAASTLHRDAIGDLRSAADGNWLGMVDGEQVLARARALSAAEKAAMRTGQHDDLNRRIMRKLNAGQCLHYFNIIGGWDLRSKLHWLNEGGKLGRLEAEHWQWLVGHATPQTMALLRQHDAYRHFLRYAPIDMIPAWDRLQGLVDGTWRGTATDIRNAVAHLNPDQKANVRGDRQKMAAIMRSCGDHNERFRVVTYLDMKVKWAVFYLNSVGALPALSQHQWSQLLSECSKADYDELVGWGEMWALVQQYCPSSLIQTTQKNSDPAAAANAFDDPAQIDAMFSTLGPAGFLAASTKVPDPLKLDEIYGKVRARSKVLPVVNGLPTGIRMGAQAKSNLRKWFFTPSSTDAECQAMFERRFAVSTTGMGSYNHTRDSSVHLDPFTKVGLTSMWQVCETLPPAAVEANPRLMHILRDSNRGTGSAYYAGPRNGAEGDVLMGYRADADVENNMVGRSMDNIYQDASGRPSVSVRQFNATLRHEIGHAVDAQLGIMETWMRQEVAGNWVKYSSYSQFVDAIIDAAGGMRYGDRATNAKYRAAMIEAVETKKPFAQVCGNHGITPPASDPGGPVSTVWLPERWTDANNGPWYNQKWVPQGGRNFQDAYGSASSLYSFRADVRAARQVTAYQWRAPGEWFAECYQVYYSETEDADVGVPVGGRLRSRDPDAAQLISQICDRGFSPQEMAGGTVAKAPGT